MKYKDKIMINALTLLLIINAVGLASADISELGTFKQNTCIQLPQSCSTCTYNNLSSVIYPDGTYALQGSYIMTQAGANYNYTFCNTSQLGTYSVTGYGDASTPTWSYTFDVTVNGEQMSTSKITTYIFILGIGLIVFVLFILGGLFIPSKNKSDELTGYILAVNNVKYLKILCWCFAYLTLTAIIYFSWAFSYNFLNLSFVTGLLNFAFWTLIALILPLFIAGIYIVIANAVRDHQVAEMLSRGLRVK